MIEKSISKMENSAKLLDLQVTEKLHTFSNLFSKMISDLTNTFSREKPCPVNKKTALLSA